MQQNIKLKELARYMPLIMHRELRRRDNLDVALKSADLDMMCSSEKFKRTPGSAERTINTNDPYIHTAISYMEPSEFSITNKGIIYAEELEEEIYGDTIPPETPLADALGLAAPAADRIVSLDHNSKPYTDAMESLDAVIAAVNEDHSNDFEEKERIKAELEAGKRLLESEKVDKSKIVAVLGGCLAWLAEKFATAPIADLATKAWELIKPLIGL